MGIWIMFAGISFGEIKSGSRDVEAFASVHNFIKTSGGDSADNISWTLYGSGWSQSSWSRCSQIFERRSL